MLTPSQIDTFQRDGVVVVENVLPETVLEAVRGEYSGLLDALYSDWYESGLVNHHPGGMTFYDKLQHAYECGCDWFQPMDISLPGERILADTPLHLGEAVFGMMRHPSILDLVETLIGPEITSNPIQHVRIKPPAPVLDADEVRAHVTVTDWHQDRGVGLEEADQTDMITVWLAITDATVENGCLQAVPRRHAEMLPHCPKRQTAIADGFVDETAARPLPVKAGGAVILHPLTPHASLPNRSNGFRWSFDLRYNVTGQPTGRAQFPDFIARSRRDPASELRDHRAWAGRWTDARGRLALAEHIPLHRWDSDAPFCA